LQVAQTGHSEVHKQMYHEISNKSLCFGTPDARVLTDPDKITYSPSSASTIDVDDDDKDFQSSPAWQPKQPLKLEHEGENVGSSITQSVLQWQKLPEPMQSIVPPNYTYILDDYRELEREKAFLGAPDSNFHAIVLVNVAFSSYASGLTMLWNIPSKPTESAQGGKQRAQSCCSEKTCIVSMDSNQQLKTPARNDCRSHPL